MRSCARFSSAINGRCFLNQACDFFFRDLACLVMDFLAIAVIKHGCGKSLGSEWLGDAQIADDNGIGNFKFTGKIDHLSGWFSIDRDAEHDQIVS